MALIKCPECGNEVSDKAPTCVKCGCSIVAQSNEASAKIPNTVTIVEDTKQKSLKKFFTSMILNASATGIYSFIMFSLLFNNATHETVKHQSDASISIVVESLTEINSTSAFRDFLIEYPLFMIVILIIGFAVSMLTYFIKNGTQKICAIVSVVFSIISCLLCVVMASTDGCSMILVIPSGVLYFISALLTIIGIKECSAK